MGTGCMQLESEASGFPFKGKYNLLPLTSMRATLIECKVKIVGAYRESSDEDTQNQRPCYEEDVQAAAACRRIVVVGKGVERKTAQVKNGRAQYEQETAVVSIDQVVIDDKHEVQHEHYLYDQEYGAQYSGKLQPHTNRVERIQAHSKL